MTPLPATPPLRQGSLSDRQIRQIERALAALGDYGEVRLIKEKGRLRFIQTVTSEAVWDAPDSAHPHAQTR